MLASLADQVGGSARFSLPRIGREITSFSFSGLKTAVLLLVRRNAHILAADPSARGEICWVIQDAIVDALVHRTTREVVARKLPLVVCGGVSANKELVLRLKAQCPQVYVPPIRHCVDNGAMIAYIAARYLALGQLPPALDIHSRWPVENLSAFYGIKSESRF